jgi:anti-sigma regulatory factor (Ser/Thr protein kinase)
MNGSQDASAGRHSGGLSMAAISASPSFTRNGASSIESPRVRRPRRPQDRLLTSHLELGPLLSAAARARAHARAVLAEWGLAELAETTELLVSELTTNALQASRALPQPLPSPVRLWLWANRPGVVVTVWDANPEPPALREAGEVNEHGRGLMIVNALSARQWGWYEHPELGGKCVWCQIPRQPAF